MRTCGQIKSVLRTYGVAGAVVLRGIVRIIKKRVDGLIALQIEDAKSLTTTDCM